MKQVRVSQPASDSLKASGSEGKWLHVFMLHVHDDGSSNAHIH